MREIRNPGVRCLIRINKEAFLNFLKERGTSCTKLSNDLGYSRCYITSSICKLHAFSVGLIDKIAEFLSVRPQDMEFIDDEAHTLLYKLSVKFDNPTQKGNKIARIREYLAQGLSKDKIFDLMYTPPIKKENDPKIKAIPMTVPKATLTHSAISEAFDEVANSEKETLGNVISECAEELSENTDMEKYLRDRELKAAQTLAGSIIKHLRSVSTLGEVANSAKGLNNALDHAENRKQRMQKEHLVWTTTRAICQGAGISMKPRPWLEALYFTCTQTLYRTKSWKKTANMMEFELSKESEFTGRYPMINKEEETNHEGN